MNVESLLKQSKTASEVVLKRLMKKGLIAAYQNWEGDAEEWKQELDHKHGVDGQVTMAVNRFGLKEGDTVFVALRTNAVRALEECPTRPELSNTFTVRTSRSTQSAWSEFDKMRNGHHKAVLNIHGYFTGNKLTSIGVAKMEDLKTFWLANWGWVPNNNKSYQKLESCGVGDFLYAHFCEIKGLVPDINRNMQWSNFDAEIYASEVAENEMRRWKAKREKELVRKFGKVAS